MTIKQLKRMAGRHRIAAVQRHIQRAHDRRPYAAPPEPRGLRNTVDQLRAALPVDQMGHPRAPPQQLRPALPATSAERRRGARPGRVLALDQPSVHGVAAVDRPQRVRAQFARQWRPRWTPCLRGAIQSSVSRRYSIHTCF